MKRHRMKLSCKQLEEAYGCTTVDGGGRVPGNYELLLTMFLALKEDGIDAVYAIKSVMNHPKCVLGILQFCGDDEIFELSAISHAMTALTPEIRETQEYLKVWTVRQRVLKKMRENGV